jgi:hypothetical protein
MDLFETNFKVNTMKNQNIASCFQAFVQNMIQSPMKRGEWFLQLMIEKRDERLRKKTY